LFLVLIESDNASIKTALIALLCIGGFIGVRVIYFVGAGWVDAQIYADKIFGVLIYSDFEDIVGDVES
jgi:hypothetical protein